MDSIKRMIPLLPALLSGFWLFACAALFGPAVYTPELPPLPEAWTALLPAPDWRFEWIDAGGQRRVLDSGPGGPPPLDLLTETSSPVLAFPCWPEQNLLPGMMRPAGAIVPYDIRGDRLVLSWRGGVDAWVYREMAAGSRGDGEAAFPLRRPELFDWPRFRELLEDPAIPEEIRRDPWLADWTTISRKIIQSGFDRRRIKAESRKELVIPGFGGIWAGTSPFAGPLIQETGGPLRLRTNGSPETFISAGGILRCAGTAWIWLPWAQPAASQR